MPKMYPSPFQLLQYQTDMQSYKFDTLRKLTPAHHAQAPKCSRAVGGPVAVAIGLSGSATVRKHIHRSRAVGAPARWAGSIPPQVLT